VQQCVTTEKIPLCLWSDDLDPEALAQARNLANLPCAFHHVALMADAHVGYGMPIGGVFATVDAVIPNAVGVDIGCGMQAVQTGLARVAPAACKKIVTQLRKSIPLGFQHHKIPQQQASMPRIPAGPDLPVLVSEFERARYQLGTLGGGNHFLELQQGSDNHVYLMVHSGSRNLGYQVATYYNKAASRLAGEQQEMIPKSWQLALLPLCSDLGQHYLAEMEYCVAFAWANRRMMMQIFQEIVADVTGCDQFHAPLDVAHNYAALEKHFGSHVWVHRKGATRAGADELGIIPGSQGSSSFIVRGLGNPQSFCSCSHGAGRVLGRKEARRKLDFKTEVARLNSRKILHSLRRQSDLDEAPGAYKDIGQVIDNQRDLITVVTRLEPLAVVKG